MVKMDRLVVANMIISRGKAPVPGTNMAPVPIAIKAPPPVLIVPPMPEAEPAKCGRTDIMQCIAPLGPVYQAGTLSGNPIAMASGLATLNALETPDFFQNLHAMTQRLTEGLSTLAIAAGVGLSTIGQGGMFGFFFSNQGPVSNFEAVMAGDADRFNRFFHNMLDQGVYLAPSPFESGFVSASHTTEDIDQTLRKAERALQSL